MADVSLWCSIASIVSLIIITVIYGNFKPDLEVVDAKHESENPKIIQILFNGWNTDEYKSKIMGMLPWYFVGLLLIQWIISMIYVSSKYGNLGKNLGVTTLYTFIPWILIFGVMMGILIMYPGFKNAFSNVIGYFIISNQANDLLTSLLGTGDVNKKVNAESNNEKKQNLLEAADIILKICGNKGVIINEINSENFADMWNTLNTLSLDSISENDKKNMRQDLLDLVLRKETIGEFCWYIYCGILVSSIVFYQLSAQTYEKSTEEIAENEQQYVAEQDEKAKQEEVYNNVSYTMS